MASMNLSPGVPNDTKTKLLPSFQLAGSDSEELSDSDDQGHSERVQRGRAMLKHMRQRRRRELLQVPGAVTILGNELEKDPVPPRLRVRAGTGVVDVPLPLRENFASDILSTLPVAVAEEIRNAFCDDQLSWWEHMQARAAAAPNDPAFEVFFRFDWTEFHAFVGRLSVWMDSHSVIRKASETTEINKLRTARPTARIWKATDAVAILLLHLAQGWTIDTLVSLFNVSRGTAHDALIHAAHAVVSVLGAEEIHVDSEDDKETMKLQWEEKIGSWAKDLYMVGDCVVFSINKPMINQRIYYDGSKGIHHTFAFACVNFLGLFNLFHIGEPGSFTDVSSFFR